MTIAPGTLGRGPRARATAWRRQAVVRPVEGTILTVARAAAEGAEAAGADLCRARRAARGTRSRAALERTPELLAGARPGGRGRRRRGGLVPAARRAAATSSTGDPLPDAPPVDRCRRLRGARAAASRTTRASASDLRYEVMYFLEAPDDAVAGFKEVWAGIGDSIVVVGGDGLYNCHIHTDDVGASIEAALDVGRPRGIRVTDLAEQVDRGAVGPRGRARATGADDRRPAPTTAVVAVVQGDGIGRIFRSLGVRELVTGGQSMNPSTAELLEAVDGDRARRGRAAAQQQEHPPGRPAGRRGRRRSRCAWSRPASIVEGFAALLAYDPDAAGAAQRRGHGRVGARTWSAAEVTRAVRDTTTPAGEVREGDWIGLTRDGVRSIAESRGGRGVRAARRLVADGHELVTVIEGEGATPADTRRITQWLRRASAPTSPSRSTTAASRCTRTSSASSDPRGRRPARTARRDRRRPPRRGRPEARRGARRAWASPRSSTCSHVPAPLHRPLRARPTSPTSRSATRPWCSPRCARCARAAPARAAPSSRWTWTTAPAR